MSKVHIGKLQPAAGRLGTSHADPGRKPPMPSRGSHRRRTDERTIQGLAGRKPGETATQAGAGLIVLAARGSVSLLPGTVSQYALRNAPCPVLVVPAERGGG